MSQFMGVHGKIELKQNVAGLLAGKMGKRLDIEDENLRGKFQEGETHRGKAPKLLYKFFPKSLDNS